MPSKHNRSVEGNTGSSTPIPGNGGGVLDRQMIDFMAAKHS